MQKVAVFGNAGGGKSRLSKKLADITGLPLYVLDKIKYQTGGAEVPEAEFQQFHQEILATERWIIDGFGSLDMLWERLDTADTLIYIDLPLPLHFWWVTKRLLTGFFSPPTGWPDKSPIWKSSLSSYRVLRLCHRLLTPRYRKYITETQNSKQVYHLQSARQVAQFLELAKTLI
ncbi:hypothetical protein C1752_01431 [Acaryochloris thomasi RCC1774]|uniref:Adenylate kinase n=1 Tax=Acaryochloris thomasi RCC1774 TaxID=1764569 RepID=A0A2W1JMB0_9CYAN|nr:adenylate kinase [Acaryochloris thomasi]PZD74346.1 hypothetical protein C1752_01431 [Acaryochloris thomasi RCC1774]